MFRNWESKNKGIVFNFSQKVNKPNNKNGLKLLNFAAQGFELEETICAFLFLFTFLTCLVGWLRHTLADRTTINLGTKLLWHLWTSSRMVVYNFSKKCHIKAFCITFMSEGLKWGGRCKHRNTTRVVMCNGVFMFYIHTTVPLTVRVFSFLLTHTVLDMHRNTLSFDPCFSKTFLCCGEWKQCVWIEWTVF